MIVVDVPTDLPDVAVDAVQIDQVLTNLLENAAAPRPPDGIVTVHACAGRRWCEFDRERRRPGFSAGRPCPPVRTVRRRIGAVDRARADGLQGDRRRARRYDLRR